MGPTLICIMGTLMLYLFWLAGGGVCSPHTYLDSCGWAAKLLNCAAQLAVIRWATHNSLTFPVQREGGREYQRDSKRAGTFGNSLSGTEMKGNACAQFVSPPKPENVINLCNYAMTMRAHTQQQTPIIGCSIISFKDNACDLK